MDFSRYGHPTQEWLEFIQSTPAAALDGFSDNDISRAGDLRQKSNDARSAASARLIRESGLAAQVIISTLLVPSRDAHEITLRLYRPRNSPNPIPGISQPQATLLYFHGGGFLFGSETSDDYLCANIANSSGALVVSIIYRHTDQHKHPAQINDAWDAFEYIRTNASSLGIAAGYVGVLGISAGATLAAGVVLRDRRESRKQSTSPFISGAVFSMPWLIHIDNYPYELFQGREVAAKVQCAEACVVPSKRMRLFSDLLGAEDVRDELLNIALLPETELADWPKTALLVNGQDPLRDDGLILAKKLEQAGIETAVHVFQGLPHGFRRFSQLKSTTAFDAITIEEIRWTLGLSDKTPGSSQWILH